MKLNYKRTICVGFAFFLICAFWQAYDNTVPLILTNKFGMSQAWSGVIMALDNILALFLLPLFGAISDKHSGKRGRRTPFILIGTIVAAIAFISLSLVDDAQLKNLDGAAAIDDPAALRIVYQKEADRTLKTPDGETFVLEDTFTEDEFAAITSQVTNAEGKTVTNHDYTNYVVPARQAYAHQTTLQHPGALIGFIALLLVVLVAMATFRSPAVALMPDVTIKPLRSKANAVINLMGTGGGILVLAIGMGFATSSVRNSLMSYTAYFSVIAGLMVLLIVLWFFGYNAVTSKYSVYASNILHKDYNLTLMLAQAAAIVAYLPVGIVASKIGRKKTILGGVVMLAIAFGVAAFLNAESPTMLMNAMFCLAGIGWATINVNSFPMVVEMCSGSDVGRYTGFYYTASMAAQVITPMFSGFLMDKVGMTVLFPYAALFVAGAFVTMLFVRHGDSRPIAAKGLEALDVDD